MALFAEAFVASPSAGAAAGEGTFRPARGLLLKLRDVPFPPDANEEKERNTLQLSHACAGFDGDFELLTAALMVTSSLS